MRRGLHVVPKHCLGALGVGAVGLLNSGASRCREMSSDEHDGKKDKGLYEDKKWLDGVKDELKKLRGKVPSKWTSRYDRSADVQEEAKGDGGEEKASKSKPAGFFDSIQQSFSKSHSDISEAIEGVGAFKDLASSIRSMTGKNNESERTGALNNLLSQAREATNAGAYQKNQSFTDLLNLFNEQRQLIEDVMERNFGHLQLREFDPTSLFYFLEHEDEVKNPSWKRRKHRFTTGADVADVAEISHYLELTEIAYLDSEGEVREALEARGDGPWELVFCDVDGLPGQPAHYVALSRGAKPRVLIGVRGTKTIADVFTDALMDPTDFKTGKAHDGIVKSGEFLVNKHKTFLDELKKIAKGDLEVIVTGHSLGAGGAVISGIMLHDLGFNVKVVGFGCPALLSEDLSKEVEPYVTTVISDADMIPRSSSATLANLVVDVVEFDWRARATRDVQEALDHLTQRFPYLLNSNDAAYATSLVNSGLESYVSVVAETKERAQPVLFPPGKCLHLYRDGRGVSCSYVPATFFSELDVTRTMLDDHLISGYDRIFKDLLADNYNPIF